MSSIWGNRIKIAVFGESHGKSIGVVLDGIPAGIKLDFDVISRYMQRRSPGKNDFSTGRAETDIPEIQSGILNGITTGTPICAIIENNSQHSSDYADIKNAPRPGHADYTAYVKYNGFTDMRGGGHFSGRLTAPIVFAGAVCMQVLKEQGVEIGAHISQIAGINDEPFSPVNIDLSLINELKTEDFPCISEKVATEMKDAIKTAKERGNSVGGVIECAVVGLKAGVGSPLFNSIESAISSLVFSVPAVKGIEFGAGFDIARMKGTESNDSFYIENGVIKTKTNNNGGILGGISNGMPIVFRTAIKPTASIFTEQETVNLETLENCKIKITGRHDPCIVPRAVPVIEAAAAIAILDLML